MDGVRGWSNPDDDGLDIRDDGGFYWIDFQIVTPAEVWIERWDDEPAHATRLHENR